MTTTLMIVEIAVIHNDTDSQGVQDQREKWVLERLNRDPRVLSTKRIDQP